MNQFLITAAAEKLSSLGMVDYLRSRAERADLAAFDRIMRKVPSGPPDPGDELPPTSKMKQDAGSVTPALHPGRVTPQPKWAAELGNGELLALAEEAGFDILITTDQNLRYQQNLAHRRIGIIMLIDIRGREFNRGAGRDCGSQ